MSDISDDVVRLFPEEDVPRILGLILIGCQNLKKNHDTEREDRVSNHLYIRLLRMPQFRNGPWQLDREVSLFNPDSDNDSEKCTGRLDFRIITRAPSDFRSYFAVEAKRLHVTSPSGWRSLADEYVGPQGMMCYVAGKYADQMRASAMLGYVYDRDTTGARKNIENEIMKNKDALQMAQSPSLSRSTASCNGDIDETKHRLGNRMFIIYHLLIPV